ncbi:hypothetical protein LSAT2_003217, partial [Lamellibrachia satsuma]
MRSTAAAARTRALRNSPRDSCASVDWPARSSNHGQQIRRRCSNAHGDSRVIGDSQHKARKPTAALFGRTYAISHRTYLTGRVTPNGRP